MRANLFQFKRMVQGIHIPVAFNSGSIRKKLRKKCNAALSTTAEFLRSLISEPDQTQTPAGAETSRKQSVKCGNSDAHHKYSSAEIRPVLPWVELPMNAKSVEAHKKRKAERREKVLGMKNPYKDYNENVTRYPEVRDIRPPRPENERPLILRKMRPHGNIKREQRYQRSLDTEESKHPKCGPRASSQKEDLDIYVIPRSVRLKRRLQSQSTLRENRVFAPRDVQVQRTDQACRSYGNADYRINKRKRKEDKKIDWVKYERERNMQQPVSLKRRREIMIENILEEPELKLRRMGESEDLSNSTS